MIPKPTLTGEERRTLENLRKAGALFDAALTELLGIDKRLANRRRRQERATTYTRVYPTL